MTLTLTDTKKIDASRPIIIGVSGGADSMALLHRLNAEGYNLVIAHCNFHLRGNESNRDETFVRQEVEKRYSHQRLEIISFDTIGYTRTHKVSVEMAARDLRYEWFRTLMKQYSASCIAIAHHADDQIETMLLNLSRGTGGQGLVGMETLRDNLWRPLLGTPRREILRYLTDHRLPHIEDSTNQDTAFKRNLIRQELIPLFERLNPSFRHSALHSMQLFGQEQALIDHTVQQWIDDHYDRSTASFELPEIQQDNALIIYRWLTPMGFSPDQINNLLSHHDRSGALFTATDGVIIERFRGRAYFITPEEMPTTQTLSQHPMQYAYGAIGSITIGGEVGQLKVSPTIMTQPITIRPAQRNDRIQVFGQKKGSRKLFDYLKDQGIPASYRPYIPVLAVDEKVLAVLPLQISEEARVCKEETPILLQYTPGTSPIAHLLTDRQPTTKF